MDKTKIQSVYVECGDEANDEDTLFCITGIKIAADDESVKENFRERLSHAFGVLFDPDQIDVKFDTELD